MRFSHHSGSIKWKGRDEKRQPAKLKEDSLLAARVWPQDQLVVSLVSLRQRLPQK